MLTYDSIPSVFVLNVYRWLLHFALFSSLLSMGFTVFVVHRSQIQKMSTYRMYIMQEVIWSFLYELTMGLYAPVCYFPYVCVHSSGFMDRFPVNSQLAVMFVLPLFGVGKGVSLFTLNVRRLLEAYPPSYIINFFKFRGAVSLAIENGVFFVLYTMFMGPLLLNMKSPEAVKQVLNETVPVLSQVFQSHPQMLCVSTNAVPILFAIPLVLFVGSTVFMLFLQYFMYTVLQSMVNRVSVQTYRLQMMLFRSLFIQVVVAAVFLLLPAAIWTAGGLFQLESAPVLSVLGSSVIVMHSTVDCVSILLTVRPYRTILNRSILRLFTKKLDMKQDTSTRILYISRRSSLQNAQPFGIIRNKPTEPEFQLVPEPNGAIEFKSDTLNEKQHVQDLKITNSTGKRHVYKVKVTNVNCFRVKSPFGFIEPNETVVLKIAYQARSIPSGLHFVTIYHFATDSLDKTPRELWSPEAKPEGVRRFLCRFLKADGSLYEGQPKMDAPPAPATATSPKCVSTVSTNSVASTISTTSTGSTLPSATSTGSTATNTGSSATTTGTSATSGSTDATTGVSATTSASATSTDATTGTSASTAVGSTPVPGAPVARSPGSTASIVGSQMSASGPAPASNLATGSAPAASNTGAPGNSPASNPAAGATGNPSASDASAPVSSGPPK
ncbi:unnamed protein product [Bursaphelenchus okinawaensis]|uniref:MSP domain-containing protein n=1 Tax=Bursaphelenchus okinawaensis TaxID=465554 RepID=A0A811L8F6_9BILA|nr:unnamed protein product [Bursaphelenchus okinawaensis]CAG9119852.1 unnamed protein product [Bursaphelenchus okinawaensis]